MPSDTTIRKAPECSMMPEEGWIAEITLTSTPSLQEAVHRMGTIYKMEHLLAPAGSQPINIPYVGGEEFEADIAEEGDVVYNFKSYWDRKDWERHPVTGDLSFRNRKPQEIVQSLQTTLYFGTLISIFSRVGIPVSTRDFLEMSSTGEEAFVRTTKLPHLITEWIRLEGLSNGPLVWDVNNPRLQRGINIKEMLNWAYYYLPMYSSETNAMSEPDKSRMQLVELSIMAIGESLCSVLTEIYGFSTIDMPTWGHSPILQARLLKNGWCISDSPFFPESLTRAAVSTDYYFGGYPCPRPRGDHSECSEAICNWYCQKITPGGYKQNHVPGCNECESIEIPPEALRLVEHMQIPVIRWHGGKIQVSAGGTENPYVAMSHVWSDGLGNDDKKNSLWACQLSRVQALVNECYSGADQGQGNSGSEAMVPFWLDTLCVPVEANTYYPGRESRRPLRKDAIAQMAEIYRLADRVLVLDSFVLSLSRTADIIDKYVRIHLSTWHHRLWTMQEGRLASRLFFQFRDGAESLGQMKQLAGGLPDNDRADPSTLCSPVRHLCANDLETFYRDDELHNAIEARRGVAARLRSCARYLRSRETSRSEDESVCVANIIGLVSEEVLGKKDADERMARLYDLVGQFDPRIIFHNHPRLPIDGYRWAPRSFLRQVPDLINDRLSGMELELAPTTIIPDGRGLPVRFSGLEFNSDSLPEPGSPVYIKSRIDGRGWVPRSADDTRTPWFRCIFKLEVRDVLGEKPLSPLRQGRRWAVILPGLLEQNSPPFEGVMGVIGEDSPPPPAAPFSPQTVWTDKSRYNIDLPAYSIPHRITVRYICRAKVTMPAAETVPPDAPFLSIWAYSDQQEWCLR